MSAHESFEQLCALAVTGDIEPEEFRRLQEHLHECAGCRASYRDFHAVLGQGLPTLDRPQTTGWMLGALGLKKRFAERARREGITIGSSSRRTARIGWVLAPVTVAAGLLLAAFVGNVWRARTEAVGEMAVLHSRVTELERRLSERREPAPPIPVAPQPPAVSDRERDLDRQLSRLRDQHDAAAAEKVRLEERVSALSSEMERVRGDSQTARTDVERLERNLRSSEAALSRASQELDSLRATRTADTVLIADQRVRLDQLAATIREQSQTIERERELLAVGKDIRDLMGARNLKIVDVQDAGTPGRKRSLPGRIFYTQGKSLIFYAFDLQNKGNANKVAFQAWGKKEGRSQAPRSLGIFYVDDSTQNRWVLKFEDPEVLEQIDQVFVTVEPASGSKQPTGRTFLSAAFLNDAPNHP